MVDSRPTRDQILTKVAYLIALRSTCSRARVGVVVAREGRVLTLGYNGAPAGMPHCNHDPVERSPEGCKISVHAEVNAIAYAARYGINLENSTLYTTYSPCLPCSQLIVNSGITRVVYKQAYRINSGILLLEKAGVNIEQGS